ncbi:MAG: hypothetical protein QQN63_09845 [Nitrosopumilus sp.]
MPKQVFITPLTDVASADLEGVGTLRWVKNKCYKYVKLFNDTGTVAGVAGDAAAYAKEVGGEDSVVVLDLNDADTKPIGAGALTGAVVGLLDTAYYLWIQIKGPVTLSLDVLGTPGDGDTFMMSGTDLKFTEYLNDDSSETNDGHPCGVINDDSAKKVILDCVF